MQLYQNETLKQVYSCEFCELFKNTYLAQDLRTAGSETVRLFKNTFFYITLQVVAFDSSKVSG